MKICTKCKIEKPLDDYGNIISKGKPYKQSQCKKCKSAYRNAKRKENPELEALRKKKQKLKRLYNLSIDDYNILIYKQNGECSICNKKDVILSVDHCHDSGAIRGLLCNSCNLGLGNFKDNSKFLLKAIKYLKETNTDKS